MGVGRLPSWVVVAWLASTSVAQVQPFVSPDARVDEPVPQPLVVPSESTPTVDVSFTRLTSAVGLSQTFTWGNTHTGGMAWVDFNDDFWPDLFITNGSGLPHYLYRNNGDGTFTDVSSLVAKPDVAIEDAGVLHGDIDNDGDTDIVVYADSPLFSLSNNGNNPPEGGPNMLYANNGDGTFTERALAAGVVDPLGRRNMAGGLADYDRDGFVDLYLTNLQLFSGGAQSYDRLLHNEGNGTFSDATSAGRCNGYGRDGLAMMWLDANMDGWPDIYVGNIRSGAEEEYDANDILYVNVPEDGRFYDGTGDPRVFGNDAQAAMGIDVGDVDRDGDWDLYITDVYDLPVEPLGNPLFLGNSADFNGLFEDNTCDVAGVCTTVNCWPCNFADFDLDGWIDLWVGTAFSFDPDIVYINDGDGTFTPLAAPGIIGNPSRGGSIADYDGDGDVDIFVQVYNGFSALYRNDVVTSDAWVAFKLLGTQSNASAIGAVVRVTTQGVTHLRRVSGGDSAHSHGDLIVHFGLGAASSADVEIEWPSGATSNLAGLAVNRLHIVDETDGLVAEDLNSFTVEYDTSDQTLLVRAKTTWRGRSSLSVDGLGDLDYNPVTIGYKELFTGVASDPGSITLTSAAGGSWVLPTTVVP